MALTSGTRGAHPEVLARWRPGGRGARAARRGGEEPVPHSRLPLAGAFPGAGERQGEDERRPVIGHRVARIADGVDGRTQHVALGDKVRPLTKKMSDHYAAAQAELEKERLAFLDNRPMFYELKQRLLNPKYRPDLAGGGAGRTVEDNLKNYGAADRGFPSSLKEPADQRGGARPMVQR